MDKQSFVCHEPTQTLKTGDVTEGFKMSDLVLEGEVIAGGQQHFYMETHAALATPSGEHGEVDVHISTQDQTLCQVCI